jgi:hypothetical protein
MISRRLLETGWLLDLTRRRFADERDLWQRGGLFGLDGVGVGGSILLILHWR